MSLSSKRKKKTRSSKNKKRKKPLKRKKKKASSRKSNKRSVKKKKKTPKKPSPAKKKIRKKNVKKKIKKKLKKKVKTVAKRKVKKTKPKTKKRGKKVPVAGLFIGLKPVGQVTHFFPKPSVAVLKIEQGEIRVGDNIEFKGYTTNFRQKIDSMQINHKPVFIAKKGDDFGLRVKSRVRIGDEVFKKL